MKSLRLLVALLLASQLCGCLFTKVVSMPMRVAGGVISVIPVAGNTAHDAIDKAADIVDEVPL